MQMQKFKGVYIFLIVLSTFFCKPSYSQSAVAVCLNEYQVTNFAGAPAVDNYNKIEDWVELYNNFTGTVSLSGWYLSNDRFNLKKWKFPSTFIMQPGQYSIVWMSGRNETKITNGLHHMHTNFTIDQCKADQWIILSNAAGVIRDSICIQKTMADHTRGRLNDPNGADYVTVGVNGWRVYTAHTFSAVNNLTPWINYLRTPKFTEPPGIATITSPTFELYYDFLNEPVDTSCVNYWYTMDGSYPYPNCPNPWGPVNSCALQYVDPSSPLIAPPTQLTMFRAVAYPKSNYTVTPSTPPTFCELNYLPSFCETNTYFCEAGVLPSDFNPKFGVLSVAIDDGSSCPPTSPNPLWFQVGTPERTVHVEYFDLMSPKKNYFELEGYASLSKPVQESWLSSQKGFNLNIDDRRGFGCNFEKQMFNVSDLGVSTRTVFATLDVYGGDLEAHSFDGNLDFCGTGLRDVFIQTLAAKNNLKVNPLHYKPLSVFVNGRFYGTFNFKEVMDPDYEAFYNGQTAKDKTTMLYHTGPPGLPQQGSVQTHTSTNNWKVSAQTDLYSFAATYPFNTTSVNQISQNYNTLKTRLDVQNFQDYMIMNSFFENSDLYMYNIAMARGSNSLTSGGRWHHYLWNMPSTILYTCTSQNGYFTDPKASPCAISTPTYPLSPLAYNGQGVIFYNLMNKNGGNAEFRRDYLMRYQDLLNGPLKCSNLLAHWQVINDLYRPDMKKHEDPGTVPFAGAFVTQPDAWDTNMAQLKYKLDARCNYMGQAFSTQNCYGLVGPYDISVEVRPDNSGTVKLNTTWLPYYAWSGKYFMGPMSFTAKPIDTTFVFDHWELENHVETNNRPLSSDSIGIYFGNPAGDKVVAVFTDRKEEAALPSGFSPNGDGRNDVFGILGSGKFSREFEMRVWNRWGQEVFRSTDPNMGWDGNWNGAQAQTGVYAYYITFKNVFNEPKVYKGNVTLVR